MTGIGSNGFIVTAYPVEHKEALIMYTVKIMNEYMHGPIWIYSSDGIPVRKFPLIFII